MADSFDDFDDDYYYNDDDDDYDYNNDYNNNQVKDEESKGQSSKASTNFDYRAMNVAQIKARQDSLASQISQLFNTSYDQSFAILVDFHWQIEKLNDQFFDHSDKIKKQAGVQVDGGDCGGDQEQSLFKYHEDSLAPPSNYCLVCFTQVDLVYGIQLCGHYFCHLCWSHYIKTKIYSGSKECFRIRCPNVQCNLVTPVSMVRKILASLHPEVLQPPKDSQKKKFLHKIKAKVTAQSLSNLFEKYLAMSFTEDNKFVRWCPQPNCQYAIESISGVLSQQTKCKCGEKFCLKCGSQQHLPISCQLVEKWNLKNNKDSGNVSWILGNTKSCPSCHKPIEKNQGCNRMQCRCGYQFCWLCMVEWQEHGGYTGICNKFKEQKEKLRMQKQDKIRTDLQKFQFYYERFWNHENSLNHVKQLMAKLEYNINLLNSQRHIDLQDMNFIRNAAYVVMDSGKSSRSISPFFNNKKVKEYDIKYSDQELIQLGQKPVLSTQISSISPTQFRRSNFESPDVRSLVHTARDQKSSTSPSHFAQQVRMSINRENMFRRNQYQPSLKNMIQHKSLPKQQQESLKMQSKSALNASSIINSPTNSVLKGREARRASAIASPRVYEKLKISIPTRKFSLAQSTDYQIINETNQSEFIEVNKQLQEKDLMDDDDQGNNNKKQKQIIQVQSQDDSQDEYKNMDPALYNRKLRRETYKKPWKDKPIQGPGTKLTNFEEILDYYRSKFPMYHQPAKIANLKKKFSSSLISTSQQAKSRNPSKQSLTRHTHEYKGNKKLNQSIESTSSIQNIKSQIGLKKKSQNFCNANINPIFINHGSRSIQHKKSSKKSLLKKSSNSRLYSKSPNHHYESNLNSNNQTDFNNTKQSFFQLKINKQSSQILQIAYEKSAQKMKSKSSRRPLLQTASQRSPIPKRLQNQQSQEYIPLRKSNFSKYLKRQFRKDRVQDKALIVKMNKVLQQQKKLAQQIVLSDNNQVINLKKLGKIKQESEYSTILDPKQKRKKQISRFPALKRMGMQRQLSFTTSNTSMTHQIQKANKNNHQDRGLGEGGSGVVAQSSKTPNEQQQKLHQLRNKQFEKKALMWHDNFKRRISYQDQSMDYRNYKHTKL